jgi:hypothetical protein
MRPVGGWDHREMSSGLATNRLLLRPQTRRRAGGEVQDGTEIVLVGEVVGLKLADDFGADAVVDRGLDAMSRQALCEDLGQTPLVAVGA